MNQNYQTTDNDFQPTRRSDVAQLEEIAEVAGASRTRFLPELVTSEFIAYFPTQEAAAFFLEFVPSHLKTCPVQPMGSLFKVLVLI